ncbi:MAG: hypothetical protein Q9223_007763, partial [Gallowayella weberi]
MELLTMDKLGPAEEQVSLHSEASSMILLHTWATKSAKALSTLDKNTWSRTYTLFSPPFSIAPKTKKNVSARSTATSPFPPSNTTSTSPPPTSSANSSSFSSPGATNPGPANNAHPPLLLPMLQPTTPTTSFLPATTSIRQT